MVRPPKICHLVLSLQPGGLEMLVLNLVTRPEFESLNFVICCLDERGALADLVESSRGSVVVVKRRPGFDLGLIPRLYKFFRKERITLLHAHSLDPMFYGGLAAFLARVPLRIHTQHNIHLNRSCWKEKLKFWIASRFFTTIVAVSEETYRSLVPYRIPSQRLVTILNGIDESNYAYPPPQLDTNPSLHRSEPGEWVLGTVARLCPEKALHRLIEAFSDLAKTHTKARLVLIGDGPLRSQLEAYSERLGVRSQVLFLGYQQKTRALLRLFDVFVLSSLTEGIPLALLEAMAARLPVVATAVGGVPEVVVNGESGILVPPDNPTALKEAILDLLTHPEKRESLAANAQKRVRETFSLRAMARAYRSLYLAEPPERFLARLIKKYILGALPKRWMTWRGPLKHPQVALTFDDGPDPTYTPKILEILRQNKAKATFFLVGEKAAMEKELVGRILQDGHEIGNHSYTHPHFEELTWKQAVVEIADAQSVLEGLQGRKCGLFRPPCGKLCLGSILGAWLKRMTIVMWSVDLKDFRLEHADEISAQLARNPISNGDIILYHGHSPAALAALPKVIESALDQGRQAVTVSEMQGL